MSFEQETLKEKTAKGLFWGGISNGLQQLLNLFFGIFLARLLNTEDYGLVGMLTIFSLIAGSLQEGGFISAINRKKNVTHQDYNAVFWTCSLFSFGIYMLLFLTAPLIARFYNEPRLVSLARYIFIGFFITSLGIAPRALLFRNLKVREQSIVSFVSLLLSGVVGVTMAFCGFAYWGIATQTLVYVSLFTGMTYYYAKWLPTLPVDFSPIREMFGFSSKLIFTNIVIIVNTNVFSVILGRLYSAHTVGNYSQANKWNYMGWSLINNMLQGISQPVFAKTNQEKERQRRIFRRLLRFTAFVSFPLMLGLALVAREFIVILLGEKWEESARLLQLLCVMGAFYPISNLFSNLLIAKGKSGVYMWGNIALCLVQLTAVVFSAPYGIEVMLMVYAAITIVWILVWHWFVNREIDLRLWDVIWDISPYLLLTCVLIYIAHLLTANIDSRLLNLLVKISFVASTYCLTLWLLRSTIFRESVDFFRKRKL
ncbi:MAG: lipopolysaccharide biosynthesis protein [Paludibacteraceae bacterium]|nr:lipopolysaccharide biosynthesis protein [Paludibacteraceae bacterium]